MKKTSTLEFSSVSVDGNTIPQPTISPMFAFAPKGEPNPADLNNLCKKRKPSFVRISYIRFEIPLPTTNRGSYI